MTTGVVKSQGSALYFVDTVSTTDPTLTKIACPTGVTGLGGPRDQIETTCLDTIGDKTYEAGLRNTGQISVPFNFIPRESSHQVLFALKEAGTTLNWVLLLSEGTAVPTVDTDGAIVAPAGRTSILFTGYVSDVNLDAATNDIIKGTLTIQRSGSVTLNAYTPS